MKAGLGISQNEESYSAGSEAAFAALQELQGEKPTFALVFSSVQFDQKRMLEGVKSVIPDALIAGSSSSGEIANEPLKKSSVVVITVAQEGLKAYGAVSTKVKENAHEAGAEVARLVQEQAGGEELNLFMMFPDVLSGNGSDIVRGIKEVMGDHFPIVGGASGDDFEFVKTFQYLDTTPHSGAVVGLGFSGNVSFGIGVKHGWVPIGLPYTVTKSEGSVVHELNGKPAIKIYEDYFGEEHTESLRHETLAKLAITYPLGLYMPDREEYLIRDPISVDEKGSITCAAEIPENSEVRLMIGSRDEAIAVARKAAEKAVEQLGGSSPAAAIIFNCIARNKLFGEMAGDEISAIRDVLGIEVPVAGFYTYGEQAPVDGEVKDIPRCNSEFHNETVVIVTLGDKAA